MKQCLLSLSLKRLFRPHPWPHQPASLWLASCSTVAVAAREAQLWSSAPFLAKKVQWVAMSSQQKDVIKSCKKTHLFFTMGPLERQQELLLRNCELAWWQVPQWTSLPRQLPWGPADSGNRAVVGEGGHRWSAHTRLSAAPLPRTSAMPAIGIAHAGIHYSGMSISMQHPLEETHLQNLRCSFLEHNGQDQFVSRRSTQKLQWASRKPRCHTIFGPTL